MSLLGISLLSVATVLKKHERLDFFIKNHYKNEQNCQFRTYFVFKKKIRKPEALRDKLNFSAKIFVPKRFTLLLYVNEFSFFRSVDCASPFFPFASLVPVKFFTKN